MARELELNVRPIFSTPLLVFSIPEAELRIDAELKRAVLGGVKPPNPPITIVK